MSPLALRLSFFFSRLVTIDDLTLQTSTNTAGYKFVTKVKGGKWKTFNDTANLDTNAGQEARLKAQNKSASIKSVKFRYKGDFVEVRAVLKPGKKKGSFTLHESAPAVPGFTAMAVERKIKVVK